MDQKSKAEALALRILQSSRNELLVALRFMDLALCKLTYEAGDVQGLATDGSHLYFRPSYLFSLYQTSNTALNHAMLHVVLHCVFYHPFINPSVEHACWDLACDIAVEAIISELSLKQLESPDTPQLDAEIVRLNQKYGKLTAERLYKAFQKKTPGQTEFSRLRQLFQIDCHDLWYQTPPEDDSGSSLAKGAFAGLSDGSSSAHAENASALADWMQISERIKVDIETLSDGWGDRSMHLCQNLAEVNREKYDYWEFLQKFSVMNEDMQINEDEFDYIYYTYGLKLYKNVPLLEPLEYQELRKIRDFVIAIDTSGSVSGELVQKFINKTYNILMQEENFFRKINIHIIQCDAEIQRDDKITSKEDFQTYMQQNQLYGFGGTDFRPVFEYVDTLRNQGEFDNLKGLLYFTDGFGTFPEQKPPYDTAFIFVSDEEETVPEVPVWAIRLILEPEEL